jgi:hypothetical protein
VQLDEHAPPQMFHPLYEWARHLRDLGEVSSARSAAEAVCREARSHDEKVLAGRLLAGLCVQDGDVATAKQVLTTLVGLARRAADADLRTERAFDLLTALDELGELARRTDDHWTVIECYGPQGRMAVLRRLVEVHGLRAGLLTEQCFSLRRAGTAARAVGALDLARTCFEDRLTAARLTFAGNPADPRLAELVAAALGDLGQLLARLGDPRAASLLSEELCLREFLRSGSPDDVRARQDLANCHLAISTTIGPDTGEHLRVATTLLAEIEAEGALDLNGRMLLSDLRRR